jgi:hypothetical protein
LVDAHEDAGAAGDAAEVLAGTGLKIHAEPGIAGAVHVFRTGVGGVTGTDDAG